MRGTPRWMSLKLDAPAINSRNTRGVQRVAKISDAFAIGQNCPYPFFIELFEHAFDANASSEIELERV